MYENVVNSIKNELRISHSKLDETIKEQIKEAMAEMQRVGVTKELAGDTKNPLILRLLKIYCMQANTDDDAKYKRYSEAWDYNLDNLRKSGINGV